MTIFLGLLAVIPAQAGILKLLLLKNVLGYFISFRGDTNRGNVLRWYLIARDSSLHSE